MPSPWLTSMRALFPGRDTPRRRAILAWLRTHPAGQTTRELAEVCGTHRDNLWGTLRKLERQEYLIRTQHDPHTIVWSLGPRGDGEKPPTP
jgi:DNA-binding IclR family transcriptional regulator